MVRRSARYHFPTQPHTEELRPNISPSPFMTQPALGWIGDAATVSDTLHWLTQMDMMTCDLGH